MSNKEALEALDVPALLLADGRIITNETLEELEYEPSTETYKPSVIARHLIPDSVKDKYLEEYLELAAEVVAKDNFWLEDDELLYKIVFSFVDNYSGWGVPEVRDFDESFWGIWPDFKTYAYNLADSKELLAQTPEELENYIDWDSWISDLKLGYTEFALPNGHVAIFEDR